MKIKQDDEKIKSVALQDLMIEAKRVKKEIKEIKEENSTDINEHNIVEITNLKEFFKPMIDPPDPPTDKEVTDINVSNKSNFDRQNFLSLIDRVIFKKWHIEITLVINKEFSLTEIALIDSGADMNCTQERLIP